MSADLFDLIHSMSRNEKRYFTVEAKKSGSKSSNYLRLFNALNAMEEYDEEAAQSQAKRRQGIKTSRSGAEISL